MNGTCVYAITSSYRPGQFKVGFHSGSDEKLISRYKTALTDPIIVYRYNCDDYRNVEKELHRILHKYCIYDSNGRKTEWFKCDKNVIKKAFRGVMGYNDPSSTHSCIIL